MRATREVAGAVCLQCSTCKQWLPPEMFNRHRNYAYGRQYNCKACHREIAKKYYRAHSEGKKQWYRRNSGAAGAHALLNRAVNEWGLHRPEQCERCGSACKPHGHHHDYNRPLDVEWLCPTCHMATHRATK